MHGTFSDLDDANRAAQEHSWSESVDLRRKRYTEYIHDDGTFSKR